MRVWARVKVGGLGWMIGKNARRMIASIASQLAIPQVHGAPEGTHTTNKKDDSVFSHLYPLRYVSNIVKSGRTLDR